MHLKSFPIKPKNALIIGNGPIGSQIKKSLNSELYQVSIFDKLSSKSCITTIEFEKKLNNFDLIIGCTGQSALNSELYKKLKRPIILASASSSDREFNAVTLRKKLPLIKDCHQNICINGIYLINCGFPINFSSQYRKIDSTDLQLTRSLLLAAILQATYDSHTMQQGFIPLDYDIQRDIVKKHLFLHMQNHTINNNHSSINKVLI